MPAPEHTMPGMPSARLGRSVSTEDGLVLAPFRALRYDPARVSSLAAVTSPPYDVVDDQDARALATADPHNIIRLILPRNDECGPEGPYEHAARTLRAWIADGILRRDADAAVYILEQETSGRRYRGILGALELRALEDGVVLPHEDVMPGPVEDRLALLRATEANLEPIFLVYEGGGVTSALIDQVVLAEDPLLTTTTIDNVTHRLWSIPDSQSLTAMAADLRPRQALIADGHHRYAAYLRYRAECRRRSGPGPWDRALSLLVDIATTAPQLTSISRVLPGLSFEAALRAAEPAARVTTLTAAPGDVLRRFSLVEADSLAGVEGSGVDASLGIDGAVLALFGNDDRVAVLSVVDPAQRAASAAEFLHGELLGKRWHRNDSDTDVWYVHDVGTALRLAAQTNGVAALLRPPTISEVVNVARSGRTMPRKSTSFGPKPRDGLVLRTLTAA
jgi:uncharacterized protein (DUF1015 family)